MVGRSYHQLCPLAYSLDIVGERWTLLIVRELLFGPRRFKDIIKGLPGIGTNLLAGRLKKLEEAGALEKATLPPPAGSTVYRLTPRGQELRPTIATLAGWGLSLMGPGIDEDFLGVVPTMSALTILFDGGSPGGPYVCELRISGEVFYAVFSEGGIIVTPGSAPSPDLIISGRSKTVLSLLGKPDEAEKAARSGEIDMTGGDSSSGRRFFSRFHSLEQMSSPQ